MPCAATPHTARRTFPLHSALRALPYALFTQLAERCSAGCCRCGDYEFSLANPRLRGTARLAIEEPTSHPLPAMR